MRYAALAGRQLFSMIFIIASAGHFNSQTIESAARHGVPLPDLLVPLSGVVALVGGLSVLLGYHTRLGAWLLVVFLVPVTLVMHNFWAAPDAMAFQVEKGMFLRNVTMLGGALLISYFGAGPLSVDALLTAGKESHAETPQCPSGRLTSRSPPVLRPRLAQHLTQAAQTVMNRFRPGDGKSHSSPRSRLHRVTPAQWLGTACLLHAMVVGVAWWHVSSGLFLGGPPGGGAIALGRLAGLLGSSAMLLQLVLVSRLPWLERSVGCDGLVRVHRRLGFALGPGFLAHPTLLIVGYARRHHLSISQQFISFTGDWPHVWLAVVAIVVMVGTVALSMPPIRRRLTYEAWHVSHLAMYLAVGLASLHQLNGAEFTSLPWLPGYWMALHALAIGCVVVFRAGGPILGFARHRFRIDEIVRESDDVVSVYLTGRCLERFISVRVNNANVAFLSKGLWAPHPFSFSAAPNGHFLRLSMKAVGDFTRRIHELTPGTFALLEGPLGAFTVRGSGREKYLMVAGGIGITPILALIESLVGTPPDIVLLYAAKTAKDLVFASELRALTAHCHFILSQSVGASDGYEHGRIDRSMLARPTTAPGRSRT